MAYESRDTVDPSLITQMLVTLLEANGQRVFPPLLRKRVRDDVCWADGAINPWRRSPMWLVLRVALQRHLCTIFGEEIGLVHYKFMICLVLDRLLDDAIDHLSPELLHFLKAKLCRRLVKLEDHRDRAQPALHSYYEHYFTVLGPIFDKTTRTVAESIQTAWTNFKNANRRPVPSLPYRADQKDLYLTLPNSGNYLRQILTEPLHYYGRRESIDPRQLLEEYEGSTSTKKHLDVFANRYFSLSETEADLHALYESTPFVISKCEEQCIENSKHLESYLRISAGAYDNNPELQSIMLLTVMELWVSIDKCATKLFPLLMVYNPGFPPEILDVLQLPTLSDMCRLQNIQEYLQGRLVKCEDSRMTIFADPAKGCFAERYFDESQDSRRLALLQQQIITAGEVARAAKEKEWKTQSEVFEKLTQQIAGSTCLFTLDETTLPATQVHDDRRCSRCYLERKARRMRIKVHENPLPSNVVFAKTVVFELDIPKAFASYRDVTWEILATLAFPTRLGSTEPRVLLRDYSELTAYVSRTAAASSFSLGSTTKPFLSTHYAMVKFPVNLESVCVPHSLKYGYFDILTKIWPGRQAQKPSFAGHCQLVLPKGSPFSTLHNSREATVSGKGPSSYEVLASQSKCPTGLNVHEYMSYQSLLSGKTRRWPAMLVELGSSNLNFSSEAVSALISHLAIQAGPSYSDDFLRTTHRVFLDKSFCERLIEQLEIRLDTISSNFREIYCMDLLITLILRMHSLADDLTIITEGLRLLERAQDITHKWISLLRKEIHKATDAATNRRCSQYAFMAAILCKRTFAFHVETKQPLKPAALRRFIECSITLQDNLVADPTSLPHLLKTALIRDLKMVYQMRFLLHQSIKSCPVALMSAISSVWPEPDAGSRSCSGLTYLNSPWEWWIELSVDATQSTKKQIVHYNLLQGVLLVDGKQLGKIPEEHRRSVILEELFGNQSLMCYPSGLPGMTYLLGIDVHGHQIHLGFRNGRLIVRACTKNNILELVPREVFQGLSGFDLPSELVNDCIHWVDLNTGIIDVRRKPNIWKSQLGNWFININTRRCRRRLCLLVDPQSSLFNRVARVFDRFEYRQHLTLFQPDRGPFQIECRRLELSFFVNGNSRLQCRQLGAEIDNDQDAKTWYGLNSKLIMRNIFNPRQRSVIVPMGAVSYKKHGIHVAVNIENTGVYGTFMINEVLGRLECPAEPRLLYLKALLHALTSFILPDPLTQITGTEESMHVLTSGYCQPWEPIRTGPHLYLLEIAKLSPKREYYPKNAKAMQKVLWNEDLTTTIQQDGFRPIVEAICKKSEQLSVFALQKSDLPPLETVGDIHLKRRNHSRYKLYQRPGGYFEGNEVGLDLLYDSRDHCPWSQKRQNVFECVTTLRLWPSELPTPADLVGILQNWAIIGGHTREYDRILLSDCLAIELATEWGPLINLCRGSSFQDKFKLMFVLSILSFRNDVNMDVVRTFLAFAILPELKSLDPPKWPCYIQFRNGQFPRIDYLLQLMKPYTVPYPGDDRSTFGFSLSAKQRRKLEALENAHMAQVEDDCKSLAQFLLGQWPCLEPSIEKFSRPVLLDIEKALEVIRGEWQRMFQNMELSQHILQVQGVLDRRRGKVQCTISTTEVNDQNPLTSPVCRVGEIPTILHLLRKTGPTFQKSQPPAVNRYSKGISSKQNDNSSPYELQELEKIIENLADSRSTVRKQYAQDLRNSLKALKAVKREPKEEHQVTDLVKLRAGVSEAAKGVQDQFEEICKALKAGNSSRGKWLDAGNLWPCMTPVCILEQLRSISDPVFGDKMRESLMAYALEITALQRLLRIEDANRKGHNQRVSEEQRNMGHSKFEPADFQDWVLLEIDANMLIRPDQVDVALATIFPHSEKNSVLQMNMGQGKPLQFEIANGCQHL